MAITRAVSHAGKTGAEWGPDVDASLNAAFSLVGGRLQSVAGTNAITATLSHPTGFSAYPDGFACVLVPAATNTDVVTLNIAGVGAVSVRNASGAALAAGDLVAGRAQALIYDAGAGYFRFAATSIVSPVVVTAGILQQVKTFASGSGTWTAPKTGWYNFWLVGGGGSGGKADSTNWRASGGAAGGVARATVYLTAGTVITWSIGAGGAAASGTNAAGNAGAASSFVIPGYGTMTANGGGGGSVSGTSAPGAAGGTASGGQLNLNGQSTGARTTPGGNAGGCIGLQEAFAAQADNTNAGNDFWTTISPVTAYGPWTSATAIRGPDGFTAGGDGDSNGKGPGCGSAGTLQGAPKAGGNGVGIIEYEM